MTFSDRTINSIFVKTTGQLGLCYQRFQRGKQKEKERNWSLIKRNIFFNSLSPYNMRVLRVGYSWNFPCKQLVLWCSAHKRSVNACSIINNQRYHFSKDDIFGCSWINNFMIHFQSALTELRKLTQPSYFLPSSFFFYFKKKLMVLKIEQRY